MALVAGGVRADDRAAAGLWVHTDDDGLTVVHPIATARAEVAEGTHLGVRYEADVISAATVDVRTSASPRGFEETRHGLALSADHAASRTLLLGTGYALSYSPDHVTHAAGLSASLEDADRIHTFGAALNGARDEVGRAGDAGSLGSVWSVGGALSWATLLSRDAVLDLSASLERQSGYLESPYRFVPITTDTGQHVVRVPEAVPDLRVRGAGRARLRLALLPWLFGRAWYRFHADDWGVAGHTVELGLAAEWIEGWLLSVHGRFYGQRGASFYEGRYEALPMIPTLRTLDRELAPSWYLAGGARLEHEAGEWLGVRWRADLRAEVTRQRYFDTPVLPERWSLTTGIGLVAER